ncbi:MAG: DUF368 domain-containing protein [Oscillibacter sp.]|nr:DUF368 domain-containing protein [Oscillibacter sp.]
MIEHNKFFWMRWMLCGALIGAGGILPGVSGGVLAVIFGIYRPFMEILTSPRQGLSRYWQGIVPLAIGWCAGFLSFAKGLSIAFSSHETVMIWLFIGLICGTLPSLLREAGKEGHPKSGWFSMVFCAAAGLFILYYVNHIADIQVQPHFGWYNFCGVLLGIGIIVPGLTTSPVLMALGLYRPMLEGLARLDLEILLSCLPGLLITMILLARFVNWIFRRYYAAAFHGILGIVAASTLSIIPLSYSGFIELFLSFSAAVAGGLLAMLLGRLEEKSDV